jgi:acetone carboxylase gamma subunit
MRRLNEQLDIVGSGAEATVVCQCGHALGPATDNYKMHVLLREGPVQEAGPWVDPNRIGGDAFVCREFFCPGCLTLLDVEIAQRHEPILWDVQLDVDDQRSGQSGPC